MQDWMFDFKSKQMMHDVQHAALSSLIFDLRLPHQIEDAKHKNQTTTLNKELSAFSQRPALIDQQLYDYTVPKVFMMSKHNIILRINSLNEDKIKLSLLSKALPFSQLNTFELDSTNNVMPATYSKVTTHEDEQFILAVTTKQWIRLIEGKDGWVLHSTKDKDKPDDLIYSCSILPDDTVLVAMVTAFHFYDSSLELLS